MNNELGSAWSVVRCVSGERGNIAFAVCASSVHFGGRRRRNRLINGRRGRWGRAQRRKIEDERKKDRVVPRGATLFWVAAEIAEVCVWGGLN